MENPHRTSVLLALVLVVAGLLTPLSAASGAPPRAPRPAARILGPGSTTEPGFSGYVTAGGGALGVARLPDGRFGICLDTGPRSWPTGSGTSVHRAGAVVGYLTSRYLPTARHDAITAAALWWAVGLDLRLNSSPTRMRGHLATLRREAPRIFTRVERRHDAILAEARHYASAGGYVADRPVLAADAVRRLAVRGASGRAVPGVAVTLHLTGGVFADGRHVWHGRTATGTTLAPRWRRTTWRAVHLTAGYSRVPATGYTMVRSGPRFQRVAVSAGMTTLARTVALPQLPLPTLHTTVSSSRAVVGATLTDAVVVSGAGAASVAGRWRLLGPIHPGPSGCDGLDWSTAPVAAFGSFVATGDGTYQVGATAVTAAGCFTYVERLAASSGTRPTAWTSAGATSETSLVLARPTLRTTVSQQRATVGAHLSDLVTVDGLPAGSTATLHWRLLGPVAPLGSACRGVGWASAPVRAAGRVTAGPGSRTLGTTTINRGGCYTYQERLDATPLSVATAWTRPGLVAESSAVAPTPAVVPHQPLVDTGGSWSPSSRVAPRTAAAGVEIPVVGLSSALQPIAFSGRTLTPPSVRVAGWWSGGAHLDALVGTTVLAGHVSDDHDRPAPFSRLRQVHVGARVTTSSPSGTTTWRVTEVATYDRQALPRSLFAQHLARRLVLITCTDKVTYPNGAFHYRRNLVVTAEPVRR